MWRKFSNKRQRFLKRLMKRDNARCRFCDRAVEQITRLGTEKIPSRQATVEHWPVPRRHLAYERWYDIECCLLACYACNNSQDATLVPLDMQVPVEPLSHGSIMALAFARAVEANLGGTGSENDLHGLPLARK